MMGMESTPRPRPDVANPDPDHVGVLIETKDSVELKS